MTQVAGAGIYNSAESGEAGLARGLASQGTYNWIQRFTHRQKNSSLSFRLESIAVFNDPQI